MEIKKLKSYPFSESEITIWILPKLLNKCIKNKNTYNGTTKRNNN